MYVLSGRVMLATTRLYEEEVHLSVEIDVWTVRPLPKLHIDHANPKLICIARSACSFDAHVNVSDGRWVVIELLISRPALSRTR